MTGEGVALVSSTLALAYVTATPYHVRRRFHARVRGHIVVIVRVCQHHGRLVLWTVAMYLPGRRRRPWWRRRRSGE